MPQHKPADRDPQSGVGASAGRAINPQPPDANTPTRGASVQGEKQNAKGGPAGANQGGAPRGGSRLEPSHQQRAAKQDKPKKK